MNLEKWRAEWFGNIRGDVLAGLVVALALIPEAIAFSIIAGVDPKIGLYASFSMAVVIAFAGGRPGMISAATAAMALLMVDLSQANLTKAAGAGVATASSAAAAVAAADVVVTMLPAGKDTLAVWGGGVMAAAGPGTLFIDSSTIDVGSARAAHEIAERAGMASLDAPVSGGVGGAEAGTLTFMCGGSGEAFAKAKPVLEAMGKRIVHCGDTGAGQAAKICNNMILGISMIGVCEAFALAEKLGLSHQALYDVASTSSGQCWSLTSYCPVPGPVPAAPSNRDYKPGFSSALMLKDLKLAQEAAAAAGAVTPLGAMAAQLYALSNAWGQAGVDFSGIIHTIRGMQDKG